MAKMRFSSSRRLVPQPHHEDFSFLQPFCIAVNAEDAVGLRATTSNQGVWVSTPLYGSGVFQERGTAYLMSVRST